MPTFRTPVFGRLCLSRFLAAVACVAGLSAPAAWAQDDPPGRVGRVVDTQGAVSWFDHEDGQWAPTSRNRPLTSGDRLSTAPNGRAELRVGSTVLRLGPNTEVELLRVDDERMRFQLHSGALAVRVRSRDIADELELLTQEARLQPLRAGHYRLDRTDDTTHAGAWRGSLRVEDARGLVIESGQRVELWREGRERRDQRDLKDSRDSRDPQTMGPAPQGELRSNWLRMTDDAFASWALREDQQDDQDRRSASSRYVSPEMTGAEDLDRHGRWEQHPEYGAVWLPFEVAAGWAPYRSGRWAWVRPWGWTWVDEARWGFAPFHYGRWVSWRGRWGWCPGGYVARPVFAPALVAWVGGPRVSIGVSVGLPAIAWVPLAPREAYVPHYRHSPVYIDRVNVNPVFNRGQQQQPGQGRGPDQGRDPGRDPGRDQNAPRPVPTGPVMYSNQGVPGAVTVVPQDVLVRRAPGASGGAPGAVSGGAPVAASVAAPVAAPTASPSAAPWVAVAPPARDAMRDAMREASRDSTRDSNREAGAREPSRDRINAQPGAQTAAPPSTQANAQTNTQANAQANAQTASPGQTVPGVAERQRGPRPAPAEARANTPTVAPGAAAAPVAAPTRAPVQEGPREAYRGQPREPAREQAREQVREQVREAKAESKPESKPEPRRENQREGGGKNGSRERENQN
jgi:hypothetical protein